MALVSCSQHLTKDRNELCVNQVLASQHVLRTTMNLVIRLTGSSIKGNRIKVSKCAPEENLSSSHRPQATENQRAAHIRPAELEQILKPQPQTVSAVRRGH